MNFVLFTIFFLAAGFCISVTLAYIFYIRLKLLEAKVEYSRERRKAYMNGEIDAEVDDVFRGE